jgi:arylsulfatase A-like enzyme
MTRRDLLASPSLALAAGRRPPNLILVITDDQGYGDLSLHGNPNLQTPNIDSIARAGVQFTQFHACPVCSPTRASLLTGRYNYRTGVVDTFVGRSLMRPSEVTLAEQFRAASYRTGIFGKWHLGDNYPMRPIDQGFETAITLRGGGLAQPAGPPGNGYFDPELEANGRPKKYQGYCTDIFFREAMSWVEQHREEPFFAYIATNAPHDPYQLDESWAKPFRDKGLDDVTSKIYGMVTNIDDNVGRLVAHLRRLKLEDDTILIFMTDNGPQTARYNAGMRGLKGTVYEGGIRVPFFLKWPKGVKAGASVDRIAAHIDVFPTLHEICGIAPPKGVRIDGRSLWPLISGKGRPAPWPDRTIFTQWHRGDVPQAGLDCMARNQRYKLVNRTELYDLSEDPAESKNLADQKPDVATALRTEYDAWFQDVSSLGFEPPRIHLGSDQEPVAILTRQDRRGGGWQPFDNGYWEVRVERAAEYDICLRFPPTAAPGVAELRFGPVQASGTVPAGATSLLLHVALPVGAGQLEAELKIGGRTYGAHFVEVKRAVGG